MSINLRYDHRNGGPGGAVDSDEDSMLNVVQVVLKCGNNQ